MVSGIIESYQGKRLIGWVIATRIKKDKFNIAYTRFKHEATKFPLEIASHVKRYLSYGERYSKLLVIEH